MKHEVNQTEFIVSLNTLSWDKAMEQDTPEATLDDPQYSTHDQPLVNFVYTVNPQLCGTLLSGNLIIWTGYPRTECIYHSLNYFRYPDK